MRSLLAVFLALLVLAGPVSAQSLSENLADARLGSRVKIALAEDALLRPFSFRLDVDGEVVTVGGVVETGEQQRRVDEVVGGLGGVERVTNEVRVTGQSRDAATDLPPVDEAPAAPQTADPEPEPEPEQVYHTVRSGDTLIAIARRYGVSVRQVQRMNDLSGSRIRAGQRLRVK